MTSENRKLRNRLSQQVFRARQAMRMKELEERLGKEPVSDAARTAELQDTNAALRKQLLDCHKKVRSLQISMKTLATATALALGIDGSDDVDVCTRLSLQRLFSNLLSTQTSNSTRLCSRCQRSVDNEDHPPSPDESDSSQTSRPVLGQLEEESSNQTDSHLQTPQMPDNDCTMDNSINPMHNQSLPEHEMQVESVAIIENRRPFPRHHQGPLQPPTINLDRLEFGPALERFDSLSSHRGGLSTDNAGTNALGSLLQFPMSLTVTDMGFEQYGQIMDRSPYINLSSQMPLRRTNSIFSDHISAIEYFLQQRWLKQCPTTFNQDQFIESIQFMIAVFVMVSWQMMTAWHTYTKADVPLKELTAWRVTRTPEAYARIVPAYRPTKLQITTPHPAIIDWIPWSSLRDKLIVYHSANPCLDDLICDIGNSYVVPADLSKLVAGLPAVIGYLSVWDLVRAIAPHATSVGSDASTSSRTFAYDADAIRNIISDDDDAALEDEVNFGDRPVLPAPDAHTLFSTKSLAIQAFKAIGMDKGAATFLLDPEFFGRHPELYDSQCDLMARGISLKSNSCFSMPTPTDLNVGVVAQYRELARWTFDRSSVA
jgi:hypothetical protein